MSGATNTTEGIMLPHRVWEDFAQIGNAVSQACSFIAGKARQIQNRSRRPDASLLMDDEHECSEESSCYSSLIEATHLSPVAGTLDLSDIPVVCNHGVDMALRSVQRPETVKNLIIRNKKYLSEIPESVGRLRNLESLDVSKNSVASLPWTVAYLQKIRSLNLSHNRFHEVPLVLSFCSQIEELFLSHNRLEVLPTFTLSLPQLRTLELGANPMVSPNVKVCNKGLTEIRKSISQRNNRSDDWGGCTEFYSEQEPAYMLRPLADLALKVILGHPRVEYLTCESIPVAVKRFLSSEFKAEQKRVSLAKCSICRHRFSCRQSFQDHECCACLPKH